ncbi:HAD-IIB family hydrolase [Mucilaginibacter glaciei]|uniref:phosphomannomutase n=1 Tax=Mucilaginibacter glaciei TaxID=2772109 RepID=A0A926NVY1_9SPHI|nr:HAD-IIB family hydrolase [Mucilaginibacter glaciei]MBD1392788.1 HAD-IIB family hydrolase [Mucilaginibacter glaciei]
MKKLIVFDLDGTLAESKAAIDKEMGLLFHDLLRVAHVAIISGGAWPQFEKQVIAHLPKGSDLSKLSILPTCGTKFYTYKNGEWQKLYAENFTDEQKQKIEDSLKTAVEKSGFKAEKIWGTQIEDRDSQITFSALGQKAPLKPKKAWDPDFKKRKKIKTLLEKMIPEFAINLGGATSIDITKPGIDKAYGMHKLEEVLKIKIEQMLFIGDALFEGGNDYPAKTTGADCIQVRDPEDTKLIIETIITCQK